MTNGEKSEAVIVPRKPGNAGDLDIKAFFDSIDHDLLMRAVRKHTDCPWVLLYVERWLKAPVRMEDGSIVARDCLPALRHIRWHVGRLWIMELRKRSQRHRLSWESVLRRPWFHSLPEPALRR